MSIAPAATPHMTKHAFGTTWYSGTGCKKSVIEAAKRNGSTMVVGWTHAALGCRFYGAYESLADFLANIPKQPPSTENPHGIADLEGFYHTTLDDQAFPPYFDAEWTTEFEVAYPWLNLGNIIDDIKSGMWHMFRVSLDTGDFVILDASGESNGTFKHSFHIIIRPKDAAIAITKPRLKQFWAECIQPKYVVCHPEDSEQSPRKPHAVIDPAPYGSNYDFRMIYQSKHRKRPLLPASHHDSPLEVFMLDYLPCDAVSMSNQLPSDKPPALPSQLMAIAPPKQHTVASDLGSNAHAGAHKPPAAQHLCCQQHRSMTTKRSYKDDLHWRQFAWLTEAGRKFLVGQVLSWAGIDDIRVRNVEQRNGNVYCMSNKSGRICRCSPGEKHVRNNVICKLSRDGQIYYCCLAPMCQGKHTPIGSWVSCLRDPAWLVSQKPALVDVNAVHDALHAMCVRPELLAPSYKDLKAVFEIANFMVTTPIHFVRLLAPLGEEECTISEAMHMTKKVELKDTYAAVKFLQPVSGKSKSPPVPTAFIDRWLEDPEHRTYTKIDFVPPPLKCHPSVFNLFTGFDAAKWDVTSSGDLWGWKELLKLASDGDDKSAYILEVFFAQILQSPGTNSYSGWNTSSFQKGAGKDSFLEIIKLIMGPQYYFETGSPSTEIFGNHSIGLLRKLLVHVNESEELRHNVAKVRHMVTTKQVAINEKYLRQYNITNLARWVVSGNNEGLVEVCRRFYVTSFSGEHVGDTDFWTRFHAWKADKRNLKAVYEHLLALDLSQVGDIQALFRTHTTMAMHRAALANADHITHWLIHLINTRWPARKESNSDESETFETKELYRNFKEWGWSNSLWGVDELPKPNAVAFGLQLSYRYGKGKSGSANNSGGEGDVALIHRTNLGKARSPGFTVFWKKLRSQLAQAHFIAQEDEEVTMHQQELTCSRLDDAGTKNVNVPVVEEGTDLDGF